MRFFSVNGTAITAFLSLSWQLYAGEPAPSNRLPVGETLTYAVYWGLFPVGWSEVTSSRVEEDGKPLINLRFTARSNKLVEKVYPVNDCIDCFVDPQTLLPTRLVKRTSEGRFECDDTLTFDRDSNLARWEDRRNRTNCEYAVAKDTRDFYSLMYTMSINDFHCGEKRRFTIACDNKTFDINVLMGEEEKLALPGGGTVAADRLKVEQIQKGLFVRKIPGLVWVSREDPRVILKMQLRMPVGVVGIVLAGRRPVQTETSVASPAFVFADHTRGILRSQ